MDKKQAYRIETIEQDPKTEAPVVQAHFFDGTNPKSRQYLVLIAGRHLIVLHSQSLLADVTRGLRECEAKLRRHRSSDASGIEIQVRTDLSVIAEPGLHADDWVVTLRDKSPRRIAGGIEAVAFSEKGEALSVAMLIRGPRGYVLGALQNASKLSGELEAGESFRGNPVAEGTYILNPMLLQHPESWMANGVSKDLFLDEGNRLNALMKFWRVDHGQHPAMVQLSQAVASMLEKRGVLLLHQILCGGEHALEFTGRLQSLVEEHGMPVTEVASLHGLDPAVVEVAIREGSKIKKNEQAA